MSADDIPEFEPARRSHVGLLIGLWAESGGGKTLTALLLARGIAAEPGESLTDPESLAKIDARIAYIDTDGKRSTHYACAPGEAPSADHDSPVFGFFHADFKPPFTPERMRAFIARAEERGFTVIITDSFSLVWEGEGGIKDIHEADAEAAVARALARQQQYGGKAVDTDKVRGDASHWKGAKTRSRKMVMRMLQSRAHLIFCGHADDKMRMESKNESFTRRDGVVVEYAKTDVIPAAKLEPKDRWVPICEKKFPRQLVISLILAPDAPGVPIPKKTLSSQLRPLVPLDRPLTTDVGVQLRRWAHGATKAELRPGLIQQGRPFKLNDPESRPVRAADFPPAADSVVAADLPCGDDAPFPGDRPAPDRYSDAAPDSERPRALALQEPMTKQAWQLWAKSFRELTESAPRPRAWRAANNDALQQLAAVSPAAHAWALEFCPPDPPSNGEHTHGQET